MTFHPNPIAFWLLALMVIGCALAVVNTKKVFHSGLCLVGCFFGIAGLYALLDSPFMAGLEILVYVGAIAMLILFAIMFTHKMMTPEPGTVFARPWIAAFISLVLFGVLAGCLAYSGFYPDTSQIASTEMDLRQSSSAQSVVLLGNRMLNPFVLPFELASVMILAAMIGSIVLARKEEDQPEPKEN